MVRYITTLLAGLALAGTAVAADAKKVTIRWHGQSFFEIISSSGTRIAIDPHLIEAFGRQTVKADLLLYSHLHSDHTQSGAIENLRSVKVISGLKDKKGDGKNVEWNTIDEQFKDVHVRNVKTYHDRRRGMERGKNSIFIIEVDGVRIAHLGDLGHLLSETQIKAIGTVDVLLIPIGGVYTINGSDAKEVVDQIKPRQFIVPMHYGTEVYTWLLPADEFLDEQENVKKFTSNELIVQAGAKPTTPTIVILHWTKK